MKIAIIGLGFVGLSLTSVLASKGYDIPLIISHFNNNKTWVEASPPDGVLYNYPMIGDEKPVAVAHPAPPEIVRALKDDLKLRPLIRYVSTLKAVNSVPPSYRVFFHNNQFIDLYIEQTSIVAK